MTGGIVSMIRIFYNLVYKWVFGEKTAEEIPIGTN